MAKVSLLLAVGRLSLVYSHPAGNNQQFQRDAQGRAITISTNLGITTSYSTAIQTLQSATLTSRPPAQGTIITVLPTGGGITDDPANLPGTTKTNELLCPESTPLQPGPTSPAGQPADNIFVPLLDTQAPPSIPSRDDHPIRKKNIADENVPIQTNKFYANFFLGNLDQSVWTHPYSLFWAKGRGNSYGMAVSHTERSQFAFGPDPNKPQYFVSPILTQHVVLSATELRENTFMSLDNLKAFSVYANFAPYAGAENIMSVPVVQGMGLITAIYKASQPVLSSGIFFRSLKYAGSVDDANVTFKYNIQLEDNSEWLAYVTPVRALGIPPLTLKGGGTIVGPEAFSGLVQVTKNPGGPQAEHYFDASAGSYAIEAEISGSVSGSSGSYTMSWTKSGVSGRPLLMYALPHHVESFDQSTRNAVTSIQLVTTTKGTATAVVADSLTMIEPDLPTTMGFAPWAKSANGEYGGQGNINLPASVLPELNAAGYKELSEDFKKQTNLDSMYYSGKALAKFAGVVYTTQTMAGNSKLAAAGLEKLKDAFNMFVNNTQIQPLVYDNLWKGVVSGGSYRSPTKDLGLDFGNTAYNDHHFHYGYFVYTAAVIGYLDPAWLHQGTNKQWVNSLVRDYASPVTDGQFPFSRAFDWFHGHSWAKGLFESADGKDQESTSEDAFSTYALKMWGRTSGDVNMEARGNLQLAILARSLNNYFLLKDDNKNQPPSFLFNKVTGILFENKCDHTTYFGNKSEYIQGIHMIPLNPSSAYTRSREFVAQEWNAYFSGGRIYQTAAGWQSILYANLAIIDPQTSYNHFANRSFIYEALDGGASRTWYLAYAAAMLNMGAAQAEDGLVASYPVQPQECTAQPQPPYQPADSEITTYQTPVPSELPYIPAPQPAPEQPQPEPQPQSQPQPQPQAQAQAQPPPPQQPESPPQPSPEPTEGFPPPPPPPSAPYTNEPSFGWSDYNHQPANPDTSHPAPAPAPAPATAPAPAQPPSAQAPRPESVRPAPAYDSWRNYFDKYRNNALNGDRNGWGRKPWEVPYSGPYHRAGAVGEEATAEVAPAASAQGGEEDGEWEDVLECDE